MTQKSKRKKKKKLSGKKKAHSGGEGGKKERRGEKESKLGLQDKPIYFYFQFLVVTFPLLLD